MEKFSIKCPKCLQQFEVDEEWIGLEAECPVCQNKIIIERMQEQKNNGNSCDIKPENPVDKAHHKYFWGKLYIRFCYLSVLILILIAGFYTHGIVTEWGLVKKCYNSEQNNNSDKIKHMQIRLVSQYNNMTNRFDENRWNLLKISEDIKFFLGENFPLEFNSMDDIDKGRTELANLETKIKILKTKLLETVEKPLISIRNEIKKLAPYKKYTVSYRWRSNEKIRFDKSKFNKEPIFKNSKNSQNNAIQEAVWNVKNNAKLLEKIFTNPILQEDINQLSRFVAQLNFSQYSSKDDGTKGNIEKNEFEHRKKLSPREIKKIEQILTLHKLELSMEILQMGLAEYSFLIEENIQKLRQLYQNWEICSRKYSSHFPVMVKKLGICWLLCFFLSLIMLAFADYLQAHFDIAGNSFIISKKISMLLLSGVVALSLSACNKPPVLPGNTLVQNVVRRIIQDDVDRYGNAYTIFQDSSFDFYIFPEPEVRNITELEIKKLPADKRFYVFARYFHSVGRISGRLIKYSFSPVVEDKSGQYITQLSMLVGIDERTADSATGIHITTQTKKHFKIPIHYDYAFVCNNLNRNNEKTVAKTYRLHYDQKNKAWMIFLDNKTSTCEKNIVFRSYPPPTWKHLHKNACPTKLPPGYVKILNGNKLWLIHKEHKDIYTKIHGGMKWYAEPSGRGQWISKKCWKESEELKNVIKQWKEGGSRVETRRYSYGYSRYYTNRRFVSNNLQLTEKVRILVKYKYALPAVKKEGWKFLHSLNLYNNKLNTIALEHKQLQNLLNENTANKNNMNIRKLEEKLRKLLAKSQQEANEKKYIELVYSSIKYYPYLNDSPKSVFELISKVDKIVPEVIVKKLKKIAAYTLHLNPDLKYQYSFAKKLVLPDKEFTQKDKIRSVCSHCNEKGYKEKYINCDTCFNSRKCGICGGQGYKSVTIRNFVGRNNFSRFKNQKSQCFMCKGTGRCVECKILRKVKCGNCNGKGFYYHIPRALVISRIMQEKRNLLQRLEIILK